MKHLLICLGATACASVSPIPDVSSHAPTHSRVLTHLDAPSHGFPARQGAPELPSADSISDWWHVRYDHLTARVELCVAPSGETAAVRLRSSSGEPKYDEAVLIDAARWRYEPFTTTASEAVCEPATVTYVP
jgi:hypothetical protein